MVHDEAAAPGRRARRRAGREREFLDATMTLLAEEGLEAFTLQRLAARLDAAVGAVYRYFPSKEALLVALQAQVLADLQADLLRTLGEASAPRESARPGPAQLLSPLLRAGRWYAGLPARDPQRYRLLATAVGDPRELVPVEQAGQVLAAAAPLFATLAGLLETARRGGALDDGDDAERAMLFWAALQGVVQLGKLARVPAGVTAWVQPERLAARLVHDLLSAWGATPSALSAALRGLDLHDPRRSTP